MRKLMLGFMAATGGLLTYTGLGALWDDFLPLREETCAQFLMSPSRGPVRLTECGYDLERAMIMSTGSSRRYEVPLTVPGSLSSAPFVIVRLRDQRWIDIVTGYDDGEIDLEALEQGEHEGWMENPYSLDTSQPDYANEAFYELFGDPEHVYELRPGRPRFWLAAFLLVMGLPLLLLVWLNTLGPWRRQPEDEVYDPEPIPARSESLTGAPIREDVD